MRKRAVVIVVVVDDEVYEGEPDSEVARLIDREVSWCGLDGYTTCYAANDQQD